MLLSNFFNLTPLDIELQPVVMLDGLMDLHVLLDFDTFSNSTQFFYLTFFNGLWFLKNKINKF